MPTLKDIVPTALAAVTAGKTLYGLPTVNYTQGLVINRTLFKQAGLNPDQPPTTWAQVEADAKAITKLGHGIYGYGDYSAGNNGGWHFSSEIDAEGGQMVNAAGTAAAFNSDQGKAVLQALHQMRFVDQSMSPTQQLAWGTLQKQMAAGKLGMYIAAPDDIYNVIVPQDGGNIDDYGMGPLPSTSGTPAGSLSGGNDYMFAKQRHPGADPGRHQVDELRVPDAGHRPVQLRPAEGRRLPGRLPRAAAVHRRHRGQVRTAPWTPARPSTRPTTRPSPTRTSSPWASRPTPRRSTRPWTRSCWPC